MTDLRLPAVPLSRFTMPTSCLCQATADNRGAILGQSTVASQKLHFFSPANPEKVCVLLNADAGRHLYNRTDEGKICHLDVFHQVGIVDPHIVASAIKTAVQIYNGLAGASPPVSADHIDIHTAGGGGRTTGFLNYGQKESLRKAHLNHVHLAVMLKPEHYACLFYLIMAVETAILSCGLELRRVERLEHVAGTDGLVDLSAYCDRTDSMLADNNSHPAVSAQANVDQTADPVDTGAAKGSPPQLAHSAQTKQSNTINTRSTTQTLVGFEQRPSAGSATLPAATDCPNRQKLSSVAEAAAIDYIQKLLPANRHKSLKTASLDLAAQASRGRKTKTEPLGNHPLFELALPESVHAAACRMAVENTGSFKLKAKDLRHIIRKQAYQKEICLLIDASASMEGTRLDTALNLAERVIASAQKAAVITFQDTGTQVVLALTSRPREVNRLLSTVKAGGATPLAAGLAACLEHLKQHNARKPLVVLITDGLPSYASGNINDPIADTLKMAAKIKTAGFKFAAIGLERHADFLFNLAKEANGSVHLIKEF